MNSVRKILSKSLSYRSNYFISVGDKIPKVNLSVIEYKGGDYEKVSTNSEDLFKKGTYILVGYPGAFTPTCQSNHLPEYIQKFSDLKSGGATKVYSISVNDPFVVKVFAEKLNSQDKMTFIADGNGELTKALEVGLDLSAGGLGFRCRRFSMLIQDGKVIQFNDEQGPKMTDLSKVSQILTQLKKK
jgi:peroxiredoxin